MQLFYQRLPWPIGLIVLAGFAFGIGAGVGADRLWRRSKAVLPLAQGEGLQPLLRPNPAAADRCRRRLAVQVLNTPADPSNYGLRRARDIKAGRVADQPALIVMHETVLSLGDTLRQFRTPHPRDADQASYHLLISRAGSVHRLLPDSMRAFGAGWSAWGDAAIRHDPKGKPLAAGSINNVALHVSLESPADGRGDGDGHSGYSDQQYRGLAQQVLIWQLRWGIPMRRLTTHAAVDRSHSRRDPRSFRWERFDAAWAEAASRCAAGAAYGLEAR
jgi:N-acetyl-anhydromuramyl-L-alanine amidase AmpD